MCVLAYVCASGHRRLSNKRPRALACGHKFLRAAASRCARDRLVCRRTHTIATNKSYCIIVLLKKTPARIASAHCCAKRMTCAHETTRGFHAAARLRQKRPITQTTGAREHSKAPHNAAALSRCQCWQHLAAIIGAHLMILRLCVRARAGEKRLGRVVPYARGAKWPNCVCVCEKCGRLHAVGRTNSHASSRLIT